MHGLDTSLKLSAVVLNAAIINEAIFLPQSFSPLRL